MIGLIIGILSGLLWFMPWLESTYTFMGIEQHISQSGFNLRGLALATPVFSVLYSIFSYLKNEKLAIIFMSIQTLIVLIVFVGAFDMNISLGNQTLGKVHHGFGLIGITLVSVVGLIYSILKFRKNKNTAIVDKE